MKRPSWLEAQYPTLPERETPRSYGELCGLCVSHGGNPPWKESCWKRRSFFFEPCSLAGCSRPILLGAAEGTRSTVGSSDRVERERPSLGKPASL
jgi:hypothetical protein